MKENMIRLVCGRVVTPEMLFMMNTETKLSILVDNQASLIQSVQSIANVVNQQVGGGGGGQSGGRIITPGRGGFTHDPNRGRGGGG